MNHESQNITNSDRTLIISSLTAIVLGVISNILTRILEKTAYAEIFFIIRDFIPGVLIIILVICFFRFKKWFGIEKATGLAGFAEKLEDSSRYHPLGCMKEAESYLDFMGHGASKWTAHREVMKSLLDTLTRNEGQARFLILNPSSEVCKISSEANHGDATYQPKKILESLSTLRHLKNRYRNLHIRLYDHTPQLRLTFIDKKYVTVGHYKAYEKDSRESPLLIFEKDNDWSFYIAFRTYFDDEWNQASEVNWNEYDKLYSLYFGKEDIK